MKVIVAPDSFKECLRAEEVAEAMASAVLDVFPEAEVVQMPLADGGEGTLEVLAGAIGAEVVQTYVSDPLGRKIQAGYAVKGQLAVIEVAQVCGLTRLGASERNPLVASSVGVGELIMDAYARGCRSFVVGLGGTATCDGGEGMLKVPGIKDVLEESEFEILTDVDAPFVGPLGAARVFAPQKGASVRDVEIIEARMVALAGRIAAETGVDIALCPGAGAAGGLGGAFLAYAKAKLSGGADRIMDMVGFDRAIQGADFVITGEGKSDAQTLTGKLPFRVLHRSLPVPVALVSGLVDAAVEKRFREAGFAVVAQVSDPFKGMEHEMLAENAKANISERVRELCCSGRVLFEAYGGCCFIQKSI